MNHQNESNSGFELSIRQLRETFASTIGQDLINEGFSIDKSLQVLQKGIRNKYKIKCFLFVYDYKPVKIEFQLSFQFRIIPIETEMGKYFEFCDIPFGGSAIGLNEGDFHPKFRDLEPKLRKAYSHVVWNDLTLQSSIAECQEILRKEIIPQFPIFSELDNFQEFVKNNYDLVIKYNLTFAALVALKLKSVEELKHMVNYLWQELKMESENDLSITKRIIRNIVRYAEISNS